jgi:hypothetical protein
MCPAEVDRARRDHQLQITASTFSIRACQQLEAECPESLSSCRCGGPKTDECGIEVQIGEDQQFLTATEPHTVDLIHAGEFTSIFQPHDALDAESCFRRPQPSRGCLRDRIDQQRP